MDFKCFFFFLTYDENQKDGKRRKQKKQKIPCQQIIQIGIKSFKSNVYRGDERIADKNKNLETIKNKNDKKINLETIFE